MSLKDIIKDVKGISFSSPLSGSSAAQSEDGNMKVKFLEAWNNFRYEMSDGTKLKKDSPLWVLGTCYHIQQSDEDLSTMRVDVIKDQQFKQRRSQNHLEKFLLDFSSKPWFTYRKGFPPFTDTTLTSDTGWGCMLRTAQMMIAQCMIAHFLGRQWRWPADQFVPEEKKLLREIIKWFIDEPNVKCPFSIHRLTDIGLTYQCKPGDWYGPGTAAYIMQDAMECGKGTNSLLNQLVVYVAQDCTVYTTDVKEVCRWGKFSDHHRDDDGGKNSRSVIILIPVRLGEATLNPIYTPCLQAMLTLDQSMGIIGGKPKHSLYFVGFQDDNLIYLDPHYCQSADTVASFDNKQLDNYHNISPRKTNICKLDPSCCFGFYCSDEKDFDKFVVEATKVLSPPKQRTNYPFCLILDGSSKDYKLKRLSEDKACSVVPPHRDNEGFTEIAIDNEPSSCKECDSQSTENECCEVDKDVTSEAKTSLKNVDLNNSSEASTSKNEKFSFSMTSPRDLFINFYRQHSRSPKSERKKSVSLEDEFELL